MRSQALCILYTPSLQSLQKLFDPNDNTTSSTAVPISTTAAPPSSQTPTAFGSASLYENTLDEPISETIKRDVIRIYRNLLLIIFPFKDRSQQSAALRNWDLFGPAIGTLALAVTLSLGSPKPSSSFSLVFTLISIGAIVLTLNVVLLGGTIGFFPSLCLLGYCLFPLDVAAIVSALVGSQVPLVKWIIVPIAIVWASWASVPFIGGAVGSNRRALAVYPLCLLYTAIGWLTLVK